MNTRLVYLTVLLFLAKAGPAQSVLEGYIDTALQQNLLLQQRQLDYRQQAAKLLEAKARLLPTVSIQARLSMARGGRAFTIPVGDLVNPVYDNLNAVNQLGAGLSEDYPAFPTYPNINNVEENFLRRQEQETVVRLQAPVYNPVVFANRRIQEKQTQAQAMGLEAFKRQLVRDVKTAYFSYLQAREALVLYENTRALLTENLRTSESLYENHQVTLDEVYVAQARLREIEQQLAGALQQEQSARAYLNFLLKRPLETAIAVDEDTEVAPNVLSLESAQQQALARRAELQQLDLARQATEEAVGLRKAAFLPSINVQADYGVQGVDYRIDDQSDFFLGSLVLSWKLFDRSAKHQVEQATLEVQRVQKQMEETRSQLQLQVIDAWYALEAARKQQTQVEAEVESARRAFRLVSKKYEQGQANQLTLSDARTQMTNAEARQIIARYNLQIRLAELEYAISGYRF